MADPKLLQLEDLVPDPANKHLPSEVAARFEVVDWPTDSPCQAFGAFGKVDLTKLTVKQAESLIRRGFKKLKQKAIESATSKSKKS